MTVGFKDNTEHVCMLQNNDNSNSEFTKRIYDKMNTITKLNEMVWKDIENIFELEIVEKSHNKGHCNKYFIEIFNICKEKCLLGQDYQIQLHYCLTKKQQRVIWSLWEKMGKPYIVKATNLEKYISIFKTYRETKKSV